jgi:hypothetical protein
MQKRHIITYLLCITAAVLAIGGRVVVGNEAARKASVADEVVVTPTAYQQVAKNNQDEIADWQTYTDEKLGFSLQHPSSIIVDERQTVEGRIIVFVMASDKEAPLPGKVTALYVADTTKIGTDAFSAFRKGDCGTECKVSYKNVPWVNINNAYGVKNPMPGDTQNYFLADKEQARTVMNVYVGGFVDAQDKTVQEKINTFEK